MNTEMYNKDEQLDALSHPRVVVIVHPDPETYYHGLVCRTDTDDTTPDIILKDILRKYSGAWEKLADM